MKKILMILFIAIITQACAHAQIDQRRKLAQNTRGGNTVGPSVTLDNNIVETWQKLHSSQRENFSKYEKDRLAILSLAGNYEVDFQFLETYTVAKKLKLDKPYFSRATEMVRVIQDDDELISLQHIIVMFFIEKENDQKVTKGPFVVKHWRQDWRWENGANFIYQGDKSWNVHKQTQLEGKWIWSVFQVDDSPRYSGIGKWNHMKSLSYFETNTMSRPLPRREFSVRNDYKLLMGSETLVVTDHGWQHEQSAFKHRDNLKNGEFKGPILSREFGLNTYRRIKDFDWSAGEHYWAKTKNYWKEVRNVWSKIIDSGDFNLKVKRDKKLFMMHFTQAEDSKILDLGPEEKRKVIRTEIKKYMEN